MKKIFIDGSAGTTGLKIFSRLQGRKDVELLTLDEKRRKDISYRKDMINRSDITFLCLPDEAAKESVALCENQNTVIIDTSTAHRTDPCFIYGMPELKGQKSKIISAKKIANPGCHASGFIALVEPLVSLEILKSDARLSCFSLTGYSGGGKKMIAQYESENFGAGRMYALSQSHKHLAEMKMVCKLDSVPVFCPIVEPFFSGMQVTVTLFKDDLNGFTFNDIKEAYKSYYQSGLIYYSEESENGFLNADNFSGYDDMSVSAFGNDDRIILVSRFDNLGKGACGAAIQNMNLVLGAYECETLNIKERKI